VPSVKRLEALADCIAFLNDFHNPASLSYRLRNPGLVKVYSFNKLNQSDADGYRIFTSLIGGFRYLYCDLEWKCSGQTRAKGENGRLKPTSTLKDLLKSFKLYHTMTTPQGPVVTDKSISNLIQSVDFLNTALKTDEITDATELKFFLEGDTNGNRS